MVKVTRPERRRQYPWSSDLPDWEWGREMKRSLEVTEELRLRDEETPRRLRDATSDRRE